MRQQNQNILVLYSKPYTELNLNYRISTNAPVPWIVWIKHKNLMLGSFVNGTK